MKVLVIAIVIMNLGCLRVEPKEKPQVQAALQSTDNPISWTIEPANEVGRYNVLFMSSRPLKSFTQVGSTYDLKESASDINLLSGSVFTYIAQDDAGLVFTFSVTTPNDLIISDRLDLSQIDSSVLSEKYSRILLRNATVRVSEKTFQLFAKEVIFENSTLVSFEGGRAAEGIPGKNGGRLVIVADSVSGNLTLGLSGEQYCVREEIPQCPFHNCISNEFLINRKYKCEYNKFAATGSVFFVSENISQLNLSKQDGQTAVYCIGSGDKESCASL